MSEPRASSRPPIFISAPIAALVEGIYRADTTIGYVKSKGNLGIGTFNDLDGELVLLDGIVYRLRPEGSASVVADEIKCPFAVATTFIGDTMEMLRSPMGWQQFEQTMLD